MKIRYIIHSFLTAAIAFSMFSCIEDIGNYSYKETNTVRFEGIGGLEDDDPYIVYLGETLTIKPKMIQTLPIDEDQYSYYWLRLGSSVENTHFDTILKAKYMEDFILPLNPRPAAYRLVYQARNNATGVTYTSNYFHIRVVGDIATGYLMLHEVDGKPELKFYNYKANRFEERTVDLTPLGDDPGKPISIVTHPDSYAPSINATNGYSVSLLTESGLYRFKHDDFHYEDSYNVEHIIFGDKPEGFQIKQLVPDNSKVNSVAMLVDQNGDYMYYSSGATPWTYGIICNAYYDSSTGTKTRFTPGGFIMDKTDAIIFFDADSKSVVYKSGSGIYCQKYSTSQQTLFKFNDVDYTPIAFMYQYFVPTMAADGYRVCMIVKMKDGDYRLLAWNASSSRIKQLLNEDFNVTEIENAKYFTTSRLSSNGDYGNYGTLFFYATDKKIYCHDIANGDTEIVYTVPDGNVISAIKVEVAANPTCPFKDNLIVTTNSETGADTSTFEIFKITPLTGVLTINTDADGNELRWTGMPKIVGVDWKNR